MSKPPQHSPGPWTYDSESVWDADNCWVCSNVTLGNARVIAAAPDMLRLLRVVQHAETWRVAIEFPEERAKIVEAINEARQLIAKLDGQPAPVAESGQKGGEPLNTIGLQQELIGDLLHENQRIRTFVEKVRAARDCYEWPQSWHRIEAALSELDAQPAPVAEPVPFQEIERLRTFVEKIRDASCNTLRATAGLTLAELDAEPAPMAEAAEGDK